MAIPRRTQAVPLARSADRPSYLADLPHVGDKSTSDRQQCASFDSSAQPAVSTHPAFAEIVSLERVGPHTAELATAEKHFLDKAHRDDNHQVPQEESERAVHQSMPRRHRRGWRRLFSQAHDQLAPFAGLIVTLALLTSAGLLFWLISRGQPANLDLRDIEFNDGALSVQLSESESLATPIDDTPVTSNKVQEPADTTQAAVPAEEPTEPIVEQNAQVSSPDAASTTPLGKISFPTTSTPFAFDYSKAFETTTAEPSEGIRGLPEVAEREDSSAESPMAR